MSFPCDCVTPLPPLHYAGWGDSLSLFDNFEAIYLILAEFWWIALLIYGSTSELALFLFFNWFNLQNCPLIGLAIVIMTT